MYWTMDHQYYPGTVHAVNDNGPHTIHYEDNDQETLDLANEQWRFKVNISNVLQTYVNEALKSNEQKVLSELFKSFSNQPFPRYQSQAFAQAPMVKAYAKGEACLLMNVKPVL